MKREVTIRISPPSPALEGKLVKALREDYRLNDVIRQHMATESYFYAQLESKDGL